MKKFFTLCASLLLSFGAFAQDVDLESFIFTDLEGNEVKDGSTIVVNKINEEGQMVVPLRAVNKSGEKQAVSMYENIDAMPNGGWQTCAFGNCMQLSATGYSSKSVMTEDYNGSIETEWMPVVGQYGTWEATLQIHIFNITYKTSFGTKVETAGNEIIAYGPKVTVRFEYSEAEPATLIFGPYTSDAVADSQSGLGLNGINATLRMAVELPVEDFIAFDGGKVKSMRVGLANAAEVTRVFIMGFDGKNIVELMSQDVNLNAAGWNEVELTEPYTLEMSGYDELLIGYDYKQVSGSFPVSVVMEGSKIYTGITYGPLGQNGQSGWFDVGLSNYGNLSIQCVVESENFPEKDIVLSGLTCNTWNKAGENLGYSFNAQNFGVGSVAASTFAVEIDDVVVGSISFNETIGSLETKSIENTIALPSDIIRGQHKLGLRLTEVDGVAPTGNLDNDYLSTTFNVFEQSVPRQKNLLEQFTSQYCTYCPRGVTFFSDLISQRDDIAWVSVHGNMQTGNDIYTINAGDTISSYEGVSGFPSASFNRTFIPDFAQKEDEIAYGLGYNMSYRQQVVEMFSQAVDYTAEAPSFVTLGIGQVYNPETREIMITVNGEGVKNAAEILASYGITVMLTENGLKARQLNEGKWVNDFEHHYVLRAVLGKCTGNAINWNGDNFTATFTYTIPADYEKDNMYVVAFVAPMIELGVTPHVAMAVNNCEMVAVKDAEASAIQNVNADMKAQSRYSLDGRQMPSAQKGLNIVRMADGSVRKVMVK